MRLLVLSIVEMNDKELKLYSQNIRERINISSEDFLEKLKNGEQLKAMFEDGTITTYELIRKIQ